MESTSLKTYGFAIRDGDSEQVVHVKAATAAEATDILAHAEYVGELKSREKFTIRSSE